MQRPLVLVLLLVAALLFAPTSFAAGVNLSWDACTAEGGVQNKTFACNTNSGTRVLYGSFALAADQPNFVGLEITVDISAQSDSLPAWWQFYNATGCRKSALSVVFDFSNDPGTGCTDPWSGQGVGGIGAYRTFWSTPQVPTGNPNEAQIVIAVAVPSTSPQSLIADTEYYGFKLFISNTKTVGSGSCGGCATPVCVTLSKITSVQNNGANEELTEPATANLSTWQSAGSCPGSFLSRQNTTWGEIRSVLR
jgi:hypothetical protein